MLPSHTISQSIPRNWVDLYETIWKPEFFPKWASGLSQSTLMQEGNIWVAKGPEGTIRIRFSPHNPWGVMDHWVDTGASQEVYMPMRILANQQGAEVMITVYRQPLMSDEKFAADIEWVTRDLQRLHTVLTT